MSALAIIAREFWSLAGLTSAYLLQACTCLGVPHLGFVDSFILFEPNRDGHGLNFIAVAVTR